MWLLAPLAGLWVAGGILDSLTGAIGWATGPIYDAVKRLVGGVIGWVSDWVGHVIDWVSAGFDAINRGLRSVGDFANSLVGWAQGMVTTAFDNLVTWVGRGLDAARTFAQGLVDTATSWALDELNRLWGYATGLVDWVNQNVWRPLWDKIEGAVGWVQSTVLPWVGNELARLGSYAKGLTDWVVGWVRDLVVPFFDFARPLLAVVSRAFGWLVWIAEHPYDWFVATWHAIGDLSPDAISGMVARAMRDDAGHIEAELVRWFE